MTTRATGTGVPGYIGWLLLLLGVALILRIAAVEGRLLALGQTADGVVVRMEESTRSRGPQTPVVQFRSSAGRIVEFRAFSQFRSSYAAGEACRVLYVNAEPPLAEIYTWETFWRGLFVASAVAATLIAGGALIVRKARERTSRR